ncbi:hypothetical protein [Nonomuraea fuscirosea]|uniref:hypothetical protein n=1 Tax=Nonomuraea fuscirosea TaxID=1291556 RepID=UPI0033CC1C7E
MNGNRDVFIVDVYGFGPGLSMIWLREPISHGRTAVTGTVGARTDRLLPFVKKSGTDGGFDAPADLS